MLHFAKIMSKAFFKKSEFNFYTRNKQFQMNTDSRGFGFATLICTYAGLFYRFQEFVQFCMSFVLVSHPPAPTLFHPKV
jgi:hypothetical protein